ncbi:MAG: hypothetical protein LAO07_07470 [Acidobacteriia bacterium]|nr:hypothetical protein [Terriglobia bacterium]
MPSMSNGIIADITAHIRRFGGDSTAWCVGTTRDWHNPVFDSRQNEDRDYDLICREAYTPAPARAVRDYFVTQCGTAPANDSSPDGKLVHAYKKPTLQVR